MISVLHDYNLVCERTTMYNNGNCTTICAGCRPRAAVADKVWRPNVVTTVSTAMWEQVLSVRPRWTSKKQVTIYPKIPTPARAQRSKRTSSEVIIGYLGRIDYTKGVEDLLEAVKGLPARVLIAGAIDTAHARKLVKMYGSCDNVTFVGSQDRDDFLSEIDVLAVTSRWREPFGRVAREALLSGCRLVAADQGGLREAAEGFGGVQFFPPGNVAALGSALLAEIEEGVAPSDDAPANGQTAVVNSGDDLIRVVEALTGYSLHPQVPINAVSPQLGAAARVLPPGDGSPS
jgi:glycosyltransferase involved in cell wall biosynthesis